MSCLRSKPRRGGKPCSWHLPQHSQHSPAAAGSTGRAPGPFCACEPARQPAGHGSPEHQWPEGSPVPSPPSFPASLPPPAGSRQAVSSGTPLVLPGTRSSRHKRPAPPADGAGPQLAFFTQRRDPQAGVDGTRQHPQPWARHRLLQLPRCLPPPPQGGFSFFCSWPEGRGPAEAMERAAANHSPGRCRGPCPLPPVWMQAGWRTPSP